MSTELDVVVIGEFDGSYPHPLITALLAAGLTHHRSRR